MKPLLCCAAIVVLMLVFCGCDRDREKLMEIRHESRMSSSLRLENDELRLKNDQTANEIAELEHRRKDLRKIAVDEAIIREDYLANDVARRIYELRNNTAVRKQIDALDEGLDEMVERCGLGGLDKGGIKTMQDLETRCSDLNAAAKQIEAIWLSTQPVAER